MSIRNKLIVAFSVLFLLLLGVSGYAFYALNASKAAQEDMNISWIPGIDEIHQVDKQLLAVRRNLIRHVLVTDAAAKTGSSKRSNPPSIFSSKKLDGYDATIIIKEDRVLSTRRAGRGMTLNRS